MQGKKSPSDPKCQSVVLHGLQRLSHALWEQFLSNHSKPSINGLRQSSFFNLALINWYKLPAKWLAASGKPLNKICWYEILNN